MIEAIKIEVVYRYPPARVWRALTEPTELAEWLMPTADFAPSADTSFSFSGSQQRIGEGSSTAKSSNSRHLGAWPTRGGAS